MAESRVRAQISALVEPLWDEHKKLREERDKVLAELAGINEEIKEVEKVLRAADPAMFVKEPTKRPGTRQQSKDRIMAAMWASPATTWTQTSLAEKVKLHPTTIRDVLGQLRAEGQVRMIGRMPNPPGKKKGLTPLGFKIAESATADGKSDGS